MSEKLINAPDPLVSGLNRYNYSSYRKSVDRAAERKAWLGDKSIKGSLKRAFSEVNDRLFLFKGANNLRNDIRLNGSERELKQHAIYFEQNTEAIKLDAVHDATIAGVELNLPENGLPETVTNVQKI